MGKNQVEPPAHDIEQDQDTPEAPPLGTIENIGAAWAEGPEASLQQAADASAAAGRPLLVKTSLHLYDPSRQTYIGWRGQAWKASLTNAEAARTFRDALGVFFTALSMLGPERLIAILRREMSSGA